MKQLEEIDICFPPKMDGTVDAAIDRLVCNNPCLTHISLTDARVTGASLVSLSRLTGVRRLSFGLFSTSQSEFTTDDILTLLRGGSRQVLQLLEVHLKGYIRSRQDKRRIKAETKVMEQEMGCKFYVIVAEIRNVTGVYIRRERREAAYEKKDVINDSDEEEEDADHPYRLSD